MKLMPLDKPKEEPVKTPKKIEIESLVNQTTNASSKKERANYEQELYSALEKQGKWFLDDKKSDTVNIVTFIATYAYRNNRRADEKTKDYVLERIEELKRQKDHKLSDGEKTDLFYSFGIVNGVTFHTQLSRQIPRLDDVVMSLGGTNWLREKIIGEINEISSLWRSGKSTGGADGFTVLKLGLRYFVETSIIHPTIVNALRDAVKNASSPDHLNFFTNLLEEFQTKATLGSRGW